MKMFYVTKEKTDILKTINEYGTVDGLSVYHTPSFRDAKEYALEKQKATGESHIITELVLNFWTTPPIDATSDRAIMQKQFVDMRKQFAMGLRFSGLDGEVHQKQVSE
jgi:hypothetical protein